MISSIYILSTILRDASARAARFAAATGKCLNRKRLAMFWHRRRAAARRCLRRLALARPPDSTGTSLPPPSSMSIGPGSRSALALVLATYVGRALRWEMMLRPLRKDANLWRIFTATAIGFTAVVLFGRAGEPVRPYLIAKKEGVSFSSQIAAWIVERMLDLLMVLLIFGIALTQVSSSAIQPGPKTRVILEAGGYTAGITGAVCLALLIALRQFRGSVQERLLDGLSFLPEKRLSASGRSSSRSRKACSPRARPSFTLLLVFYTVVEWMRDRRSVLLRLPRFSGHREARPDRRGDPARLRGLRKRGADSRGRRRHADRDGAGADRVFRHRHRRGQRNRSGPVDHLIRDDCAAWAWRWPSMRASNGVI